MNSANPLWGAPRIHGELLKVGIEISQATVAKFMDQNTQATRITGEVFPYGIINPGFLVELTAERQGG